MGLSLHEYWSGLPFPPPGEFPQPVIGPVSLRSPALADGFFATWEAQWNIIQPLNKVLICSCCNRMNLENMVSERSQSQKTVYNIIWFHLFVMLWVGKCIDRKVSSCQGLGRGRYTGGNANGTGLVLQHQSVLKLDYGDEWITRYLTPSI